MDGSADPPRVTKEVDTVNQGASGRAMARKPDREAAPPLTARASTLGDRLDLYRAERDTLDLLRENDEKEEVRQSDIEGLLDQVVRDFQRVLITARVNLAEVFTAFDKDGDGTVTIKEFRTGLRALKVNVADELVAKLIEMMDRDGDGEIDYREFTKQLYVSPGPCCLICRRRRESLNLCVHLVAVRTRAASLASPSQVRLPATQDF